MKEIYPTIEKLIKIVEERVTTASSIFTKSAYTIVLKNIKDKFKNFNEDDIVISKNEYLSLLNLKRNELITNISNSKRLNMQELVIKLRKQLVETEEKIEYIDLT